MVVIVVVTVIVVVVVFVLFMGYGSCCGCDCGCDCDCGCGCASHWIWLWLCLSGTSPLGSTLSLTPAAKCFVALVCHVSTTLSHVMIRRKTLQNGHYNGWPFEVEAALELHSPPPRGCHKDAQPFFFFFYYGSHSLMLGGYPPTAIGYPPTAIGYPPTAIGYPPTAISYPPAAIVGRIGHSEFFFFFLYYGNPCPHPTQSVRFLLHNSGCGCSYGCSYYWTWLWSWLWL